MAVLLRIAFDREHYMCHLGISGEPKAMINLTTSFVYALLMGGCRGMKPVLAAVPTALQI